MAVGILETLEARLEEVERKLETSDRKLEMVLTMVPNEIKGHKAAGAMVGLSEHSMLELAKRGVVPHKKHGRRVSYALKDLIEYKMTRELTAA